jgi:hypothetical protein
MADSREQVFAGLPVAIGGGRIIASPFQFVAGGEDNLRVTVVNSAPGCRVAVQGRRFDTDGQIRPLAHAVAPTDDRVPVTRLFQLGAGALLNLTVFAVAGAPVVGQTFVIVQLVRGFSGATEVLGTLLAGYVTTTQALGWPGSPIVSSTDGEPALRFIKGTTPAPGSAFAETVPTGARWELLAVRFFVAASAVVVTRYIRVYVISGVTSPWIVVSPRALIASETRIYSFSVSLEYQSHDYIGVAQHGLPLRALLPAGAIIFGDVAYVDVADQVSAPEFVVREWLEVP